MMFYALNIIIIILLLSYSCLVNADGSDTCKEIYKPKVDQCCESTPRLTIEDAELEDIKKCVPSDFNPIQVLHGPPRCDIVMCVAKAKRFYKEDDTPDFDVLKKHYLNYEPADLVSTFEKECFQGDINKYAPNSDCEVIKLLRCTRFQRLKACEKWKSDGACTKVKSIFDECAKSIN